MPLPHKQSLFFSLSQFFSHFLLNFQSVASLSILPLPRSNLYHSNRIDLLYPTVPLPPNHCHSAPHCHPNNHFSLSLSLKFFLNFCLIFNRSQLCQYCHYPLPTCTIRRALISSIQRYHSHSTTATHHPTATQTIIFFSLSLSIFSQFLLNFQSIASPPILPLPPSNLYHSTRLDLLYPTVPQSFNHCHSPCHCHPNNHVFFSLSQFFLNFCLFFNRSHLRQYCHYPLPTCTIRRALM
jgi:hypothetical protein